MTSPTIRKFIVPVFAGVGLLTAAFLAYRQPPPASAAIPVYSTVEDVPLVTHDGKATRTAEWKGRLTVVNFMFTSCGHTCPMLTRRMVQLQKKLAGAADVTLASITVDPETDKPKVLKEYGRKHGADFGNWTFYTGDYETIHRLAEKSFLSAMQASKPGKQTILADVTHGEHFTAVDASGRIRALKHIQSDADLDDLVVTLNKIR